MNFPPNNLMPIGRVFSSLKMLEQCPFQTWENAPKACIEIYEDYRPALEGVREGQMIDLLTWLHLADRSTLMVHPRNNPKYPLKGVFATRSSGRPNPIGIHTVEVSRVDVEKGLINVIALEVLDQTPVIDLKLAFSRSNLDTILSALTETRLDRGEKC